MNLKHLLASTFSLNPFISTDTNFTKTAIITKPEQLSLSLESENPQRLPLRASIAPEDCPQLRESADSTSCWAVLSLAE